jgi:hypothetical protein
MSDGWTRKNRFQVRFQNHGTMAVASMTGWIACALAGFDEKVLATDLNLEPVRRRMASGSSG